MKVAVENGADGQEGSLSPKVEDKPETTASRIQSSNKPPTGRTFELSKLFSGVLGMSLHCSSKYSSSFERHIEIVKRMCHASYHKVAPRGVLSVFRDKEQKA